MHKSNRMFWEYAKEKYPGYFSGDIKVIEYGSHMVNGSVRDYFGSINKYIGVDWRAGENVDLVSLAHNVDLPDKFNTVISASLLEHDPYWEKSIPNMIQHLSEDGILLLSWGAALNGEHCLDHAPDNSFHPLKAELVMNKLTSLGIYIHEFGYEGHKFEKNTCRVEAEGMGEVYLIGFKNKKYAIGNSLIEDLILEDKI